MTQRLLSVVTHDDKWGNIPEGTYIRSALLCAYVRLKRSDGWGVAQSNPKHHCVAWGGSVLAISGAWGDPSHMSWSWDEMWTWKHVTHF